MSTVLVIAVLTLLVTAAAAQLEANHRRARAHPWGDGGLDRDAERVAHDLVVRQVSAADGHRPSARPTAVHGRRVLPPNLRAA
jgi:hypothetical protein